MQTRTERENEEETTEGNGRQCVGQVSKQGTGKEKSRMGNRNRTMMKEEK